MNSYVGKKILVTGHTGFKGTWLTLILNRLGAEVVGISLKPKTNSIFTLFDKVTVVLISTKIVIKTRLRQLVFWFAKKIG